MRIIQVNHLLIASIILCSLAACNDTTKSSNSSLSTPPDQPNPTTSFPPTNNLPTSTSIIPASSTPDFDIYPEGLKIAYTIDDTLYLWNNGQTQEVVTQSGIYSPQLSPDGEWIIYRQDFDLLLHDEEFWLIKTDGTERHRILILDDLANLIETEHMVLVNDLSWLPYTHSIVFNTQLYNDMIDGNPYKPNNDLYRLELDGRITQIAPAGLGGEFTASPDGRYVAVSTGSEIGIWDLETRTRVNTFEYAPLRRGCDCIYLPQIVWDEGGNFLVTAIPSPHIHYPDDFSGEPEEIWRLAMDGSEELVAQVAPTLMLNNSAVLGPTLEYYFYYDGSSCEGGYFTIHIRDLATSTDIRQLPCESPLPAWMPNGEHFLLKGEDWKLGNIFYSTTENLEFLNLVNSVSNGSIYLTWIDDTYFLLVSQEDDFQNISLATLQGVVAQIVRTPQDASAQFSYSLSKR